MLEKIIDLSMLYLKSEYVMAIGKKKIVRNGLSQRLKKGCQILKKKKKKKKEKHKINE